MIASSSDHALAFLLRAIHVFGALKGAHLKRSRSKNGAALLRRRIQENLKSV